VVNAVHSLDLVISVTVTLVDTCAERVAGDERAESN